jgi:hypothetical protein
VKTSQVKKVGTVARVHSEVIEVKTGLFGFGMHCQCAGARAAAPLLTLAAFGHP